MGGYASEYGGRLPFLVAAVLAAGGVVARYVKLAETLPLDARRPFDIRVQIRLGLCCRSPKSRS